jgi:hypothetical protein
MKSEMRNLRTVSLVLLAFCPLIGQTYNISTLAGSFVLPANVSVQSPLP